MKNTQNTLNISIFLFFQCSLVFSGNFLVMFFGWELGFGLNSFLLISFWSEKKSASKAGNKAFILKRIGTLDFPFWSHDDFKLF
ncbi:MAG: hypothetical protein Ct9H90mP10_01620 [Actinomycetota bacterium]|nr:MAG: hypothetical protein Ct9H90mP10_01620 [Actinomycetota bacterium]